MSKTNIQKFTITLDITLRILSVGFIWWNPFIGLFTNSFLDAIDGDILARIGVRRKWYQPYDKFLDMWFYSAIFLYTVLYLSKDLVWIMIVVAFFVRLVGFVLYLLTKKEEMLFFFPGLSNTLFFIKIAFPFFFKINGIGIYPPLIFLLILTFIKEWQLHVAKLDITHFYFPFIKAKEW